MKDKAQFTTSPHLGFNGWDAGFFAWFEGEYGYLTGFSGVCVGGRGGVDMKVARNDI